MCGRRLASLSAHWMSRGTWYRRQEEHQLHHDNMNVSLCNKKEKKKTRWIKATTRWPMKRASQLDMTERPWQLWRYCLSSWLACFIAHFIAKKDDKRQMLSIMIGSVSYISRYEWSQANLTHLNGICPGQPYPKFVVWPPSHQRSQCVIQTLRQ